MVKGWDENPWRPKLVKRKKQCCPGFHFMLTDGTVIRVKPLSSTLIYAFWVKPYSKQVLSQGYTKQGTYTAAVAMK